MKVDNRYCKAFISDLKSCSYWNNSIGYMSDEDYKATCQALIVLEDIYEKMPDEVKSHHIHPYTSQSPSNVNPSQNSWGGSQAPPSKSHSTQFKFTLKLEFGSNTKSADPLRAVERVRVFVVFLVCINPL